MESLGTQNLEGQSVAATSVFGPCAIDRELLSPKNKKALLVPLGQLTVVKEANLLIHVVDAASAIPEMHINTVHEILDQIEADVPEILVFNKIDRIDKASLNYLTDKYPDAIFVSSTKGTNIEKLISEITTNVFGDLNEVSLIISPKDLDQLHKYSSIVSVKNIEEGLEVTVEIRNYYLENLLQKDVVKLLS